MELVALSDRPLEEEYEEAPAQLQNQAVGGAPQGDSDVSAAGSQKDAGSMVVARDEQVFLTWDLVAPKGTPFNSLIHYAALFDTGQLTGKGIVVSKNFLTGNCQMAMIPPPPKGRM